MEAAVRTATNLKRPLLLLSVLVTFSARSETASTNLHVQISGIIPGRGELAYLLFDKKEGFPRDRSLALMGDYLPAPDSDQWDLKLKIDLEKKYVLTVYQDLNKNRKLDKNFLGIPKEPVGASNNPKNFFGPPTYEDCEFVGTTSPSKISIELRR